jgi:hypothetical protein
MSVIKKFFEENLMYLIDDGYIIKVDYSHLWSHPSIDVLEKHFIVKILLTTYPGAHHSSKPIKYDDIKYDLIPFYSLLVDNFDVKSAIAVTKFPESASSKSEGVDISDMNIDQKFDTEIRFIEIKLSFENLF